MGFYNDGNIYGVLWVLNANVFENQGGSESAALVSNTGEATKESHRSFEKKQDTKLTKEDIAEIKAEYDKLTEYEKNMITTVKFYTCCSDTYGPESYMNWWPGDIERLHELFDTGDTTI